MTDIPAEPPKPRSIAGFSLQDAGDMLRRSDMALAIAVMAILAVLIVPLPPILLDMLLAVSIILSVLILMMALFIQAPLEFSAFPTILLISTMLRLSLNMASTRLILGGLDWAAIPVASPEQYDRGWQVPLGIGNPSFFESYEQVLASPPIQRTFYGFHLDAQNRWLDHHAIGVDGPLFHWDADDASLLHLYLLSYERHTLLNHVILVIPQRS